VRIADDWYAPIGGVLLFVCGVVALAGFPLDDVWHRLFGQDVTLWSPTHIQMVGGAALSTLALWLLIVEGKRAAPEDANRTTNALEVIIAGAFLVGLSALQAEFDYSVPQFRLVYHPVLLAMSAGAALVAARIRIGRGAALGAVGIFLLIRAPISGAIEIMDHSTLHFPLYLVEAIAVEVVGLFVPTTDRVKFGVLAGLGIGTIGLATEWAWSHIWMTMSWPRSMLGEAVVAGVIAGVVGGLAGALMGGALEGRQRVGRAPSKALVAGVLLGIAALIAWPFPDEPATGTATVTATPQAGSQGWADIEVQMQPTDLARDSEWFNVTSWQGGGSVVHELEPQGDGLYAAGPVPVDGEWKTLIRLHDDRALMAVPIYLPEDPAIGAEGVPVPTTPKQRAVVEDKELLLREAKDVPGILVYGASGALALMVAGWVALIVWCLRRLDLASVRRAAPAPA
jgi:hypothetical protein